MAVETGKKAVFLDKDGTLVENVPYNVDPGRVRLAEGALQSVRALHEAGYALVVVSNQSGVARGYFDEHALAGIEKHLRDAFEHQGGAKLAGFYYCPHHPQGSVAEYAVECECRKPRPGMILRAAKELGIRLEASWMIGDILDDMEAGRRAGCRTVLLDNGNETVWQLSPERTPDYRAANLIEAARVILAANSGIEMMEYRSGTAGS